MQMIKPSNNQNEYDNVHIGIISKFSKIRFIVKKFHIKKLIVKKYL